MNENMSCIKNKNNRLNDKSVTDQVTVKNKIITIIQSSSDNKIPHN